MKLLTQISGELTDSGWALGLEFAASLVSSLAWPATLVVLLLLFRRAIDKLLSSLNERIPTIESLKTRWIEAVWTTSAVETVAGDVKASIPDPVYGARVVG